MLTKVEQKSTALSNPEIMTVLFLILKSWLNHQALPSGFWIGKIIELWDTGNHPGQLGLLLLIWGPGWLQVLMDIEATWEEV